MVLTPKDTSFSSPRVGYVGCKTACDEAELTVVRLPESEVPRPEDRYCAQELGNTRNTRLLFYRLLFDQYDLVGVVGVHCGGVVVEEA